MSLNPSIDSEWTLDPPGSIAVIGAGPLGLEAALYGRYLGYVVEVFEQAEVGQSLREQTDAPLPMLPDRCLSPLAIAALKAQDGGVVFTGDPTFPLTIGQWVHDGLLRIANTDLLQGKVHSQTRVSAIEHAPPSIDSADNDSADIDSAENDLAATDVDDDSYVDGDVPPDYRLTLQSGVDSRQQDFEAVIVATGTTNPPAIAGLGELIGEPYLFRIGDSDSVSDEERLHRGWHQIVRIYAQLGGRAGLDLYRPVRS